MLSHFAKPERSRFRFEALKISPKKVQASPFNQIQLSSILNAGKNATFSLVQAALEKKFNKELIPAKSLKIEKDQSYKIDIYADPFNQKWGNELKFSNEEKLLSIAALDVARDSIHESSFAVFQLNNQDNNSRANLLSTEALLDNLGLHPSDYNITKNSQGGHQCVCSLPTFLEKIGVSEGAFVSAHNRGVMDKAKDFGQLNNPNLARFFLKETGPTIPGKPILHDRKLVLAPGG